MAVRTIPLEGATLDAELSTDPDRISIKRVADPAGGGVAIRFAYPDAPLLVSAETNATGDEIELVFDQALDESVTPAVGDFAIAGDDAVVDGVTIVESTVTLTLTGAIENGDEPLLDYTAPATNGFRNLYGQAVASIVEAPVTNNVPE